MKTYRFGYPLIQTHRRLLRHAWQKDRAVYLYCLFYTLAAACYPFLAVMTPKFLLQELTRPQGGRIASVFLIIGVFLAAATVLGFFQYYLKSACHYRFTLLRLDYMGEMCNELMTMDYQYVEDAGFFEKYDRSFIATQSNDAGLEGNYHKMFEAPAQLAAILVFVVLIGGLSPWVLLALLIHLAVSFLVQQKGLQFEYGLRDEEGHWNRRQYYYATTSSDFSYGKDIRVYGFKDRVLRNFSAAIAGYTAVIRRIQNHKFLLSLAALATLVLSDAVTYGLLIREVLNGMGIADFSMYLTATVSLTAYATVFLTALASFVQDGQYVHDFFTFLDSEFYNTGGTREALTSGTLEVEFRDVSFRYPGTDKDIFRHLNLTIHSGERLAVVGVNGAGKSTLVKLMTGLFDPTQGCILINGIPASQFSRKALQQMFSVVFQEINVLAFTLRENVACVSSGTDDARVMKALEAAGLSEKVNHLSKGLDQTMLKIIDPEGTEFSGGESQKLAIARALYKDGRMVIMDEPTSALDALAEADIYRHFDTLIQGKTAVYISHRLSSTKFCDRIALFDGDGLAEYGTHEELMARKGKYYEMFMIQGKYYQEGADSDVHAEKN